MMDDGEDFTQAMLNWTTYPAGTSDSWNASIVSRTGGIVVSTVTITLAIVYGLIFLVGITGNGLSVYVIARYVSMKTVTNLYILNLSISDGIYLLDLPLIITTSFLRNWIFGSFMCRVYYAATCINQFTGSFTLAVMSADRYFAVCHPIAAMTHRTPGHAMIVIVAIWTVSVVAMFPVVFFAELIPHSNGSDTATCTVNFPAENLVYAMHLYVTYSAVVGFLFPVVAISVFYTLLVAKLRTTGPGTNGSVPSSASRSCTSSTTTNGAGSVLIRTGDHGPNRQSRQQKVTRLVTSIIAVYVICWLPYWSFQIALIVDIQTTLKRPWTMYLYYFMTVLTYAHSMLNPLLYGLTNKNFRDSFASAFRCASDQANGQGRRLHHQDVEMMRVGKGGSPLTKNGAPSCCKSSAIMISTTL